MTLDAGANLFVEAARAQAEHWKSTTSTLPAAARLPAPYIDAYGKPSPKPLPFCLPATHSTRNLLPDVHDAALAVFKELEIPWHNGIDAGPSNHLLDSQVQCVNALGRMMDDPERLIRGFGGSVEISEVLQIESGRYLTFEYIGPKDYLKECPGRQRRRGTMCTSVDAAFEYRTSDGSTELALIEWKFTEAYPRPRDESAKQLTRSKRYRALWDSPSGPLRSDVVPFEDMLVEPFYQLMRQQLLAHELERDESVAANVVRVIHVLAPMNQAYQQSLTRDSHRSAGSSVAEAWHSMLRDPSRYLSLDPKVFLDPSITSAEYVARYSLEAALPSA